MLAGCAGFRPFESLNPVEREKREFREASIARHAAFRALPDWKKSTYSDDVVIATLRRKPTPAVRSIVVSLKDQRAIFLADGLVARDFPVATGKRSHPTPTGTFKILEKKEKHSSNMYGKVVDAEGNVLVGSADARRDIPPEGGAFVGSPMPFWMRLTPTGVGLHVGHLPGRPASHGCIRMPRAVAPKLFAEAPVGTPVEIVEWYQPAVPSSER